MTIFVGADLASSAGLCYGRPNTVPFATAIRAPVSGKDLGLWGGFFWRAFNGLFDQLERRLEPDEGIVVNYESPILPVARWDKTLGKMTGGTNIETTRKLQGLGMILETVIDIRVNDHGSKIEVYECNLKTMKRELGGSGSADKASMVFAARKIGIVLPDGPEAMDAADGVAAWLLAVKHKAPEHYEFWLKRLHGGRHDTMPFGYRDNGF